MPYSIEPKRFAQEMASHWTQNLGNVASSTLFQTWEWIGTHINLHLADHESTSTRNQWYVLSAPTGTGKTQ